MNCRDLRSSSFSLFRHYRHYRRFRHYHLYRHYRCLRSFGFFSLDCLQFSSLYLVASLLLHHGSIVIAHVLPRSITVFFRRLSLFCPPGTDGSGEGKYVGDGYSYCSRRLFRDTFSVIGFVAFSPFGITSSLLEKSYDYD